MTNIKHIKKQSELAKIQQDLLLHEQEDADKAGKLGFMARAMVQATMPHSDIKKLTHKRVNGNFSIEMSGHSDFGLPFGTVPRLLMIHMTTQALRNKSPFISLGNSVTAFMESLDTTPTGGKKGTITSFKNQLQRLCTTSISCLYNSPDRFAGGNGEFFKDYDLWWNPKNPNQDNLFDSFVVLNDNFYHEIIDASVPIDLRAVAQLRKSPLALDIYLWLTYRMSYLRGTTTILWEQLEGQFGSSYKCPRNFKKAFKKAFIKVAMVYPNAHVSEVKGGILLKNSRPHVSLKSVK